MDFVGGVDFVGGEFTEVGARKIRHAVRSKLKQVARAALVPPGVPLPRRRTRAGDEYDAQEEWRALGLVAGVDFVGNHLTEVGATKLRTKIKAGLKKVGTAVAKTAQAVVKVAAKVVPPPYNVAFAAASKVADKAASAIQKAKAAKAVQGLGALAKAGDKKAAATLATVKLAKDAAAGKPAAALQFVASARAKAATAPPRPAPARPAPARPAARPAPPARPAPAQMALRNGNGRPAPAARAETVVPATPGAYQVTTPDGETFTIHL